MATRRQILSGASVAAAAFAIGEPALHSTDAANAVQGLSSAATIASVRPPIRRRSSWHPDPAYFDDAVETLVRYRGITIHHTVNGSSYTRAAAAAVVRSIYRLHAKDRGWGDIGYNFLIDKYGTIYEGRAGSFNGTPLPTHTAGHNTVLMGVAMIGTFTSSRPTAAARASLIRLLTWACWRYSINPKGTATYRVGEDPIIERKKLKRPPGTVYRGQTIAGHRYFNKTVCPGNALAKDIPAIRRSVASSLKKVRARHGAYTPRLVPPTIVKTPKRSVVQVSLNSTYSWTPVSGASVYEILKRPTGYGRYLFDPRLWLRLKRVTGTVADVPVAEGESAVIAVRALSSAGEQGAFAALGRVSRPLFARQLLAKATGSTKKWKRISAAGYPGGGYLQTRTPRARLKLSVKSVASIVVFAPTSPGLGVIRVRLNGKVIKEVSLDGAAKAAHSFEVKYPHGQMYGEVSIEAASSAAVRVVGVAFIMPKVATDTTLKKHLTEYRKGTYPIRTTRR